MTLKDGSKEAKRDHATTIVIVIVIVIVVY